VKHDSTVTSLSSSPILQVSPGLHPAYGRNSSSRSSGSSATRLRFAAFGDAVNTAQRLESGGRPGCVTVSEELAEALRGQKGIIVQPRENISAEGKGSLAAYEVVRDG
jgi:class 3 adenylate cyclase